MKSFLIVTVAATATLLTGCVVLWGNGALPSGAIKLKGANHMANHGGMSSMMSSTQTSPRSDQRVRLLQRALESNNPELFQGLPWPASVFANCCPQPEAGQLLSDVQPILPDCLIQCPKVKPGANLTSATVVYKGAMKVGSSTTVLLLEAVTSEATMGLLNYTLYSKPAPRVTDGWDVVVNHAAKTVEVVHGDKHRQKLHPLHRDGGRPTVVLATLRNPLEEFISLYHFWNPENPSWEAWCGDTLETKERHIKQFGYRPGTVWTCYDELRHMTLMPTSFMRMFANDEVAGLGLLTFAGMKADMVSVMAQAYVLMGLDPFHENMDAIREVFEKAAEEIVRPKDGGALAKVSKRKHLRPDEEMPAVQLESVLDFVCTVEPVMAALFPPAASLKQCNLAERVFDATPNI